MPGTATAMPARRQAGGRRPRSRPRSRGRTHYGAGSRHGRPGPRPCGDRADRELAIRGAAGFVCSGSFSIGPSAVAARVVRATQAASTVGPPPALDHGGFTRGQLGAIISVMGGSGCGRVAGRAARTRAAGAISNGSGVGLSRAYAHLLLGLSWQRSAAGRGGAGRRLRGAKRGGAGTKPRRSCGQRSAANRRRSDLLELALDRVVRRLG